jgi:2-polyprenyl-3-methyl-5-hydroxy-6-metoxy-1,4-benzoquinol methylase
MNMATRINRSSLRITGPKAHTLVKDEVYGYRKLHPTPKPHAIHEYYQKQYYTLISKGRRAPELRRLMKGGKEASAERKWLNATLHSDVAENIEKHAPSKKVLDVGCGSGELLRYLSKLGYCVEGLELSGPGAAKCRRAGLLVHQTDLANFGSNRKNQTRFGAILLMNVLEHVCDPVETLKQAAKLLAPGGILVIRVPNDFSELQMAARKHLKAKPWWITIPDHINYFNFTSMRLLLEGQKFEVIHEQGDFPMEIFLLMGLDYTRSLKTGKACHEMRKCFEASLPSHNRRNFYQALAQCGMGRTCMTIARWNTK